MGKPVSKGERGVDAKLSVWLRCSASSELSSLTAMIGMVGRHTFAYVFERECLTGHGWEELLEATCNIGDQSDGHNQFIIN